MITLGKAYGFFDCSASREAIQEKLPVIQRCIQAPSQLELSLSEMKEIKKARDLDVAKFIAYVDVANFIANRNIYATFPSQYAAEKKAAKPIAMTSLQYMLEATYIGATNEETANWVGDVINGIYMMYGNNMPFNVAIIAEIDGEFLFKE